VHHPFPSEHLVLPVEHLFLLEVSQVHLMVEIHLQSEPALPPPAVVVQADEVV
jgi:hypothetical protein